MPNFVPQRGLSPIMMPVQSKANDDRDGVVVNLTHVVRRLEAVIDEETVALSGGRTVDLKEFNYRKGHGFLELNRTMNGLAPQAARDPAIAVLFTGLKSKLERNQRVLKLHLDAVQEVASVISKAISDQDSDGTYGALDYGAARRT